MKLIPAEQAGLPQLHLNFYLSNKQFKNEQFELRPEAAPPNPSPRNGESPLNLNYLKE